MISQVCAGLPGDLANEYVATVVSRELEGASALPFGAPVFRGSRDHTCSAVAASSGFWGLAVRLVQRPEFPDGYAPGDTVGILLEGYTWVTATRPCSPGQPVYYDATGNLQNASDGATPIAGATFETTAQAGKPVLVRLV